MVIALRKPSRTLGLWMNGTRVGTWSIPLNAPDVLQYDPKWVNFSQGRPLSLSLGFTPGNQPIKGAVVRGYFENLLPDSIAIRERMAQRFGAKSTSAFDLLSEIGRDCVGALEILPEGEAPPERPQVHADPMSEHDVAQALRGATATKDWGKSADDGDFRISLAGAQEKTALLLLNGQWCMPRGSTPTTHIFKLPLGVIGGLQLDRRHSIENEWLCSAILRKFGVPTARCWPAQFEDVKALVVERFDRAWRNGPSGDRYLLRLPQEDMCQATGTPPTYKYEADGGPGMDKIFGLLDGSTHREEDRRTFFKAQLLFWLLRAPDGHAKNFSLMLRPGGRYQLAPLYDVLSAYPVLGKGRSQLSPFKVKMAMAIRSKNPHWEMREIVHRHWKALGAKYGITTSDGRKVDDLIEEIAGACDTVIDEVRAELPANFPPEVAAPIFQGMRAMADKLRAE